MKIDVYSHCFMITEPSYIQKKVIDTFCRGLVQFEMVITEGVKSYRAAKVFASADIGRNYYRLHINALQPFLDHVSYNQIRESEYVIHRHSFAVEERHKVKFKVKDLPEPRDPQPKIIDHILSDGTNKIVTLQTGKGKTFLTKYSMNQLGLRSCFFMKGGFIDRWVPDMEESFHFKGGELLVVRGGKSLSAIMHMAIDGELGPAKCIFISINTYSAYIKDFEEHGVTETYPIAPGEFFSRLNIGMAALDEGHQNPHQVMKLFCYTHIPKFITLSATLDTMDAFMTKMYELMYPRPERFNGDYYDVYIKVCAIKYQLNRPKNLRWKGFGGAYNHTAYEASMMQAKNRVELKNYLDLIHWAANDKFVKVMEKGQKMLIFCGTVKFCTLVQKYLQKKFPDLVIGRYVSGDKMSVFEESDIVISTVLSAGTAVDIKNLRIGLMTTAINSQQSNEQTLGRTRRLKGWPDCTPEFLYFVCTSIDKHVRYHDSKMEAFSGKVLYHGVEQAPINV